MGGHASDETYNAVGSIHFDTITSVIILIDGHNIIAISALILSTRKKMRFIKLKRL